METQTYRHEQTHSELLHQASHEFDWGFAEQQFANVGISERKPEQEVYGRSLSTIHNLGKKAIELGTNAISSPEADQARIEFFTSVEEGFGTDADLGNILEVRDFDLRPVMDGKVMAKDNKRSVSEMTAAGLISAKQRTAWDPHFAPQYARTKWDHKNALIVDKMVRGETDYNTRIVISPFPEEAAKHSGNTYWGGVGYVPHLKRGFVQLYHDSDEGLVSGSLSFDGSNKERLREIFRDHDIEIPEGEITDNWLQYALTDNLSTDEAKALSTKIADLASDSKYKKSTNTVDVTDNHRALMRKAFNESYIHACESLARGYQTSETRKLIAQLAANAQSFNDRYKGALKSMLDDGSTFDDDDMTVMHELLVYSTIEMMRAVYLRTVNIFAGNSGEVRGSCHSLDPRNMQNLSAQAFQHALGGFGAEGARNNRPVFACGLSISPGKENPVRVGEGDSQKAYGGVDSKPEDRSEMKCVNCPECKTFHETVKKEKGKYVCDNPNCKLAGSHAKKKKA